MNIAAIQRLRRLLADDQPTCGLWITLESPSITEMAVACGRGLLMGTLLAALRAAGREPRVNPAFQPNFPH